MQTPISIPNLDQLKARQKATWEAGDFGQIARTIEHVAAEFMARLPLRAGQTLLDVACGTGNLAVLAAQRGCRTSGLDLASNLVAQARERAAAGKLEIEIRQGDAEALPYPEASFDVTVSMFGVMFAPQQKLTASELCRVTKPGGLIALANWTPEGFLGKLFQVFRRHLPPTPGLPSPTQWGTETSIHEWFGAQAASVKCERRIALMRYPFPPAEAVDFFREYYGPTQKAFAALGPDAQEALYSDLVELQSSHNTATVPDRTENPAEYLEVRVVRAG